MRIECRHCGAKNKPGTLCRCGGPPKKRPHLPLDRERCNAIDDCPQRFECLRFLCRNDDIGDKWISPTFTSYDKPLGADCDMFLNAEVKE